MRHPSKYVALPCIVVWLLWPSCGTVDAQKQNVFDQVAYDQQLGTQIPLSLSFRDHTGQAVTLDQYFGSSKPVILTLVYYECPMLCNLELNGLVRSLKTLPLEPGRDFTLLTVSFDPSETPELATRKRRTYLEQLDRDGAETGWHFLTGDQQNIQQLCQAVGFQYAYDADRDEYAHASGIVMLTPAGKTARYFYGIDFPATDLRLGLTESSKGTIGSVTDQLLLLCYGYDPQTGKYGFLIMNMIRLGALATVTCLFGFIGVMLYRERGGKSGRRRHANGADRGTHESEDN